MSLRLASSQSSHLVSLWGGLGIPGSEVPTTGDNGGSPLANDGITATSEYRIETVTAPGAGTLTVYPDTSYEFSGPDGTYAWTYRVYEDSVDRGTANETLVIGSPVAAFASTTTLPAFSGSASVSSASPETAISATTALPTFSWSPSSGIGFVFSSTTGLPTFSGNAHTSPAATVITQTMLPVFMGSSYGDVSYTNAPSGNGPNIINTSSSRPTYTTSRPTFKSGGRP